MHSVILQAGALILCGVIWRLTSPMGLPANAVRRHLTGVVYMLLLPALVLVVLWRAPLGLDAVRVAFAALIGLMLAWAISWFWFRLVVSYPSATVGALVLAATFPNSTYLGLPVLESVFGSWSNSIAIQYDLFACTPVLLSLGALFAARQGGSKDANNPLAALLRIPPLWAAVAGIFLNLLDVPLHTPVEQWLDMLGGAVIPLMLFAMGLSLGWEGNWQHRVSQMWPVILIQLFIMPAVVFLLVSPLGLEGQVSDAVVIEAAMPSMMLGIVLCDRYGLDTTAYAMAVTVTTALSMLSLSVWFGVLGVG
ncbi:MAG: AEC family transporter [Gammaproteobacteria bacterium]|nr:AEC family transporter [Gammaproteobacteria bacterium]